jgi:hypothetical protein
MTTLVRDGAPEARVFKGARPLRLFTAKPALLKVARRQRFQRAGSQMLSSMTHQFFVLSFKSR